MHHEPDGRSAEEERDELVAQARAHRCAVDAREGQLHVPNHIPRKERVINVVLSLMLFAYCTVGAMHDDIFIPGKQSRGVHLHGTPMWIVYAAMLCAVANMMSVVVDHYDVRANERNYRRVAFVTQILGWGLFFGAFFAELFLYRSGGRH